MPALRIASWLVRIAGLTALVLGVLLWISPELKASVQSIHMLAGILVTAGLIALALMGIGARAGTLSLIAIVIALILPVFGMTQASITALPKIVVQVAHLLVGVLAIGVGEALAARIIRRRA